MASRTAMNRFFPLLACLTQYSAKMARVDLIAGVAVAGFLIPEGMAYAGIAGVPPEIGLYAAMLAMFVYALPWDVASTCSYTYFVLSSYSCRAHRSPRFRRPRAVQGFLFPPLP